MLDNGYVYPAATRLALFRSTEDWALVIEEFGFSPRAGLPHTLVSTFASRVHARAPRETYRSDTEYANHLERHPHDESCYVYPIEHGDWQDEECDELVSALDTSVVVRRESVRLPTRGEYAACGIDLASADRIHVFELCRFLAHRRRAEVLASDDEQRVNVLPSMTRLLQLDEWHHPDIADDDRPSRSETFQQLARVLETGEVRHYRPTKPPNTHWRNWPGGGSL